MCNTRTKCVMPVQLHIEILDYDWLMSNRVWLGRPEWCNLWPNFFPD